MRLIENVSIESALKTLPFYGNLQLEIEYLIGLYDYLFDNKTNSEFDFQSLEVESNVKQWILEMKATEKNQASFSELMLIYTSRNKNLIKSEFIKLHGEDNWKEFIDAEKFKTFLKKRLSDAIGFRMFSDSITDAISQFALVAFIQEPIRDKRSVALLDENGKIRYKTKFTNFAKAVILTDNKGYSSNENKEELVDIVKKAIGSGLFRTDDNSLRVVKGSLRYQVTCEDVEYVFRKFSKK